MQKIIHIIQRASSKFLRHISTFIKASYTSSLHSHNWKKDLFALAST